MKSFVTAILLIVVLSAGLNAAVKSQSKTVTIQTSAICGSCKNRIEKALKATDGVEGAVLNLDNKKVKVKYNPEKLSEAQIKQVIVSTGYDADDMKKDETAFAKLPQCCQKPMEGDK